MRSKMWHRVPVALAVLAGTVVALVGAPAGASTALPTVRHVFVIMLENESATSTFGNPKADPELAKTLPSEGAYLPDYYAIGHASNDNYVGFVSGQPPNILNQTDCVYFLNFIGAAIPGGVDEGTGCVYPASTLTIGNQLTSAGYTWKAYEQDMGNIPSRESAACGHPAVGAQDKTQEATYGDGYATRHDPFPYFHDVIDNVRYCDAHIVALGSPFGLMPAATQSGETGLAQDLKSIATTPNLSFITPNLCMDGHDYPCKNEPSGTSALNDIDRFLSTWVPMIMASPAYKENGLIEVTFDEASDSDTSSCCGETPDLTQPLPGLEGAGGGGGKVGAVLLSPFIKPGTVSTVAYNHFSSLASFEAMFGLSRLGEARQVTNLFGRDIFNQQ